MRLTRPLTPLLLIIAILCIACGQPSNNALKYHSVAAETLDDLATRGRAVVLEMRQTELDKALAAAQEGGTDPRTAVLAAAARFDDKSLIPAVNTFILAKDAYVRSVLVLVRRDDADWGSIRPILLDAVTAYKNLRTATGDRLPALPDVVTRLLSP